jgi:hypothetical protein
MMGSRAIPVLFTLAAVACGGEERAADAAPAAMVDAMQQATAAVQERASGVEPVSAESLAARLPEEVSGLERVDVERTEGGAMGMTMSATVGRYESDDGRHVTIVITDVAGMGATGLAAAAAWTMTEFDRTTDTGYDRTSRFEGFQAMESLSRAGGRVNTELAIVVAERFIVRLEGRGVDMDALEDAARTLDLRGLSRMD